MLKRSFGSVKVFSLDRDTIFGKLREAAFRLAQDHPEVEEITLFGSLARGDAVPGSDADVLVLLQETTAPFQERLSRYTLRRCGIGVDVFPYTKAELSELRRSAPRFYAALTEQRVILYQKEKPHIGLS